MDLAQMTAELAQRKAFLPGKTVKLDFAEDGAIVLDGVDGQVTNNQEAQADTTLHISWDDWRALASGKLDPVSAYMQGKLRVDGSMRSEEHTSELQSLMRISYAVFCLKKKKRLTALKH